MLKCGVFVLVLLHMVSGGCVKMVVYKGYIRLWDVMARIERWWWWWWLRSALGRKYNYMYPGLLSL